MKNHKLIRIFISSTFSDFEVERELLNNDVYKRLSRYCKQEGYTLQFVDLRWGVPKSAELNHETMAICLRELERSREISQNSYLYILLGNRYGWRPLPEEISKEDFALIEGYFDKIPIGKDKLNAKALFVDWYKQDTNSVNDIYCLRSAGEDEKDKWFKESKLLRTLLDEAFDEIGFSELGKIKYYDSATEQEVFDGALSKYTRGQMVKDSPIAYYVRTIKGIGNYVDVVEDKSSRLEKLKTKLGDDFPYEEGVFDVERDNYSSYLEGFRRDATQTLKELIDKTIFRDKQRDEYSETKQESVAHIEFRDERIKGFQGRKDKINDVLTLLNEENQIVVVTGVRGVGKSSFHAQLSCELKKEYASSVVIPRFIGVTSESCNIFKLIKSVAEAIYLKYDKPMPGGVNSFADAIKMFHNSLTFANENKPLYLIFDALDQLDDVEDYRWLPESMPEYASIVLGTRIGKDDKLIERYTPKCCVTINKLSSADSKEALNFWLNSAGRKTIDEFTQNKIINKAIENDLLPIYLRLLFEKIKSWRSDSVKSLADIESCADLMIKDYFFNILGNRFGKEMVRRALTYIKQGDNGVSELEIMELLRRDEVALADIRDLSFRDIAEGFKSIPFMVWARFYGDIEPYMKSISRLDQLNIYFFHEQIADAIEYDVKIEESLRKFYNDKIERDDISARILTSLPYHTKAKCMHNNDYTEFTILLSCPRYIVAKINSNLLSDYISECEFLFEKKGNNVDVVKALFVSIANVARGKRTPNEKKKVWDNAHSEMIFRHKRDLHVEFFNIGIDRDKIKDLLIDFTENELAFINVSCTISKINYLRRMGKAKEALALVLPAEYEKLPLFKSGMLYEIGYSKFLAGEYAEVYKTMNESAQCSGGIRGCFSEVVGLFLASRIELFKPSYDKSVMDYLTYVDENLEKFLKEKSDKVTNILEHIGIICYYNSDAEGARLALDKFLEHPFVKKSTDKTREKLAKAMLEGLIGDKGKAAKLIEELIEYKQQQVKLESAEGDVNSLIESVAQMHYFKWSWTGNEDVKKELINLTNTSDNGNTIWIRDVDSNKKFKHNSEIAKKVNVILELIVYEK